MENRARLQCSMRESSTNERIFSRNARFANDMLDLRARYTCGYEQNHHIGSCTYLVAFLSLCCFHEYANCTIGKGEDSWSGFDSYHEYPFFQYTYRSLIQFHIFRC